MCVAACGGTCVTRRWSAIRIETTVVSGFGSDETGHTHPYSGSYLVYTLGPGQLRACVCVALQSVVLSSSSLSSFHPHYPPSLSTIADAAADAFAIARPRLLQYFAYNFVTQPAARQPNPIATLECAPYKIFFIIFKYSHVSGL